MMKSDNTRTAIILCSILLAAACEGVSPTAPTTSNPDPEAEPVTLTGNWMGSFVGLLISTDAARANLTQTGTTVTGDWSTPMPATLVAFGAPADLDISGPVTGTVTGTAAELTFGFLDNEVFRQFFAEGCALSVSVSAFTATTMEGTWMTNASCLFPAVDSGTMMLTRP